LRGRRGPRPGRGRETTAHALLDREALCLRNGQSRGGPSGADLRRPRLHARVRGRAFLPRAARRSHLGRDERNPAAHHRPRPAEARPRRPVTRTTLRARSRFLIAAVFTVAVLAGCGRDATESRPGGGRNVLNIYNWSDYVAPD